MDKAEAIKILKDFHNESALFSVRTALETLHPELKESEDERIRKEILQSIRDNMVVIHKDECIVWLEKQGQPKPSMQNGITINGVEYELIEDYEADECERCALREKCHYSNEVICTQLFENSYAHHRFKKR